VGYDFVAGRWATLTPGHFTWQRRCAQPQCVVAASWRLLLAATMLSATIATCLTARLSTLRRQDVLNLNMENKREGLITAPAFAGYLVIVALVDVAVLPPRPSLLVATLLMLLVGLVSFVVRYGDDRELRSFHNRGPHHSPTISRVISQPYPLPASSPAVGPPHAAVAADYPLVSLGGPRIGSGPP
jgi:hypothetical protein